MTDEQDMFIALSLAAAAHADREIHECRMWLEVALDCCLSWVIVHDDEDRLDAEWLVAAARDQVRKDRVGAQIYQFPSNRQRRQIEPRVQLRHAGATASNVSDFLSVAHGIVKKD